MGGGESKKRELVRSVWGKKSKD